MGILQSRVAGPSIGAAKTLTIRDKFCVIVRWLSDGFDVPKSCLKNWRQAGKEKYAQNGVWDGELILYQPIFLFAVPFINKPKNIVSFHR